SLLAIVLVLLVARSARAEVDAEQVRASIERGVDFLIKKQNKQGAWPDFQQNYTGGVTALCTLALLNSGVGPGDENLEKSLANLRTLVPTTTYVTSLQTMVFCAAEPKRDLPLIQRNVRFLESNQVKTGERRGCWSYPSGGGGDNSNSQFALLALHEAERAGASVQPETWKNALEYWEACQNGDGSWGYWRGM